MPTTIQIAKAAGHAAYGTQERRNNLYHPVEQPHEYDAWECGYEDGRIEAIAQRVAAELVGSPRV